MMNCLNRGEFLNGVLLDSLDHLDKYALDKSKKKYNIISLQLQ